MESINYLYLVGSQAPSNKILPKLLGIKKNLAIYQGKLIEEDGWCSQGTMDILVTHV